MSLVCWVRIRMLSIDRENKSGRVAARKCAAKGDSEIAGRDRGFIQSS